MLRECPIDRRCMKGISPRSRIYTALGSTAWLDVAGEQRGRGLRRPCREAMRRAAASRRCYPQHRDGGHRVGPSRARLANRWPFATGRSPWWATSSPTSSSTAGSRACRARRRCSSSIRLDRDRPGGAGNAANNVAALGGRAIARRRRRPGRAGPAALAALRRVDRARRLRPRGLPDAGQDAHPRRRHPLRQAAGRAHRSRVAAGRPTRAAVVRDRGAAAARRGDALLVSGLRLGLVTPAFVPRVCSDARARAPSRCSSTRATAARYRVG